jgi:hypothetical protein
MANATSISRWEALLQAQYLQVCAPMLRANKRACNVPTSLDKPMNVESDDCLSLSDALTVVASNKHAPISVVVIAGRVR